MVSGYDEPCFIISLECLQNVAQDLKVGDVANVLMGRSDNQAQVMQRKNSFLVLCV